MAFLNFNNGVGSQPYNFWQQNPTPINPSQGLFGNVFQQENQTPLQPAPPNPKQEHPAPLLNNLPQENKTLSQYKLAQSQNYLDPLINPTQAGVQRDLFAYKNDWQNANDAKLILQKKLDDLSKGKVKLATNAEGETVDDTENQITKLQEGIDLLNFHQGELAKAAEMTRNTAHALGIDTTGFNANNTLAESQQIMHTNDARAVQGLLNLQPVQTQMRNYYNQMRQQGLSDREARLATSQMHDEFRINNINQLWNGIRDYGTNGDGSLNDFGAALLGKLSYESPDMVELFANQYASPKETLSEANANERLAAQIQANALLNAEKLKNTWDIAAANQAGQNARLMARLQTDIDLAKFKEENANARAAARLNSAVRGLGGSSSSNGGNNNGGSGKMMQEIQDLMVLGLDENAATGLYLQKHYGDALNKLSGDSELTKDQKKLVDFIDGYFGAIEFMLGNGDMDAANQMITELQNKITGGTFEYVDSASTQYLLSRLQESSKVANGQMSLEELQAKLNASGESMRDWHELNNNSALNAKSKEYGEKRAAELKQKKPLTLQQIQSNKNPNSPNYIARNDIFNFNFKNKDKAD